MNFTQLLKPSAQSASRLMRELKAAKPELLNAIEHADATKVLGKTFGFKSEQAIRDLATMQSNVSIGVKEADHMGHLGDLAWHVKPGGQHAELHDGLRQLQIEHLTVKNLHEYGQSGGSEGTLNGGRHPLKQLQHDAIKAFEFLPRGAQVETINSLKLDTAARNRLLDPHGVASGSGFSNHGELHEFVDHMVTNHGNTLEKTMPGHAQQLITLQNKAKAAVPVSPAEGKGWSTVINGQRFSSSPTLAV